MVAHRIVTDEQVREMRATFDGWNYRDLARKYGISKSYAQAIVYYRNRVSATSLMGLVGAQKEWALIIVDERRGVTQ